MKSSEIIESGKIVYNQQDISPALLDVSSRQINYWIDHAIIPFVEKQQDTETTPKSSMDNQLLIKTKWIRLNLAQAVWVSIVKSLFNFKIPLETIKLLAYKVWQEPREQHYADTVFKYHIEENPNGLSNREITELKGILENEILMEHHFRTIINPFTDMVKSAIDRTSMPHTMLYVPETNDYNFHCGDKNLIINLSSVYLENPMISLPLIPIIAKVLTVDFENTKKLDLTYLTNVEKQIRDIVVFKRPKIVEIAFEDAQIKPIVITEMHKSREQLSEYILSHKIAKGSKLLIDIRSQDNYKITLIKK